MAAKKRLPTLEEIDQLVSFLPRLYADGFTPFLSWEGGTQREDGVLTFPWPRYAPVVEEFFYLAGSDSWSDYDYRPEDAHRMLENDDFIKTASLAEIKTMLTFCVRGERFCDGHWGEMIERGRIRRLLQRLAEFGTENA